VDTLILRQQGTAVGFQFRPQLQGTGQVGQLQGVLFHTDKVQAGSARRALLKQLPGTEKIQAGAETGFPDAQLRVLGQSGKTLGQVAVGEEYIAGFLQAVGLGEVHVIVTAGQWLPLLVPVEQGVLEIIHGEALRPANALVYRTDKPELIG